MATVGDKPQRGEQAQRLEALGFVLVALAAVAGAMLVGLLLTVLGLV